MFIVNGSMGNAPARPGYTSTSRLLDQAFLQICAVLLLPVHCQGMRAKVPFPVRFTAASDAVGGAAMCYLLASHVLAWNDREAGVLANTWTCGRGRMPACSIDVRSITVYYIISTVGLFLAGPARTANSAPRLTL